MVTMSQVKKFMDECSSKEAWELVLYLQAARRLKPKKVIVPQHDYKVGEIVEHVSSLGEWSPYKIVGITEKMVRISDDTEQEWRGRNVTVRNVRRPK